MKGFTRDEIGAKVAAVETDLETFAGRLNHAMALRGVSQAVLSKETGISDGQISNLCSSKRGKAPSAELALKIARALTITLEWLVEGTGPGPEAAELPPRLRHRPEWAAIVERIQREHPEIDALSLKQIGNHVDDPKAMPDVLDVPLVRDMAAAAAAWRVRAARRPA